MQKMTGLHAISVEQAREIASKKGLKPARVRGTEKVQFTKGRNKNVEAVDWTVFEGLLSKRHLGVYEAGGFMKIMKSA